MPTPTQDTRTRLLDAAFTEVYKNGYHGAATAAILKVAAVPKGSMYHFFDSKKALVLAVINERIFPRMEIFFDFTMQPGESAYDALERIFQKMQQQELLIMNGCPLHRLMVEMAPLDPDFDTLLQNKFNTFVANLATLFQSGIERGELKSLDSESLARFIITATWGELSLSPSLTSPEHFQSHYTHLLHYVKQYVM